jgi:hypothetical protein
MTIDPFLPSPSAGHISSDAAKADSSAFAGPLPPAGASVVVHGAHVTSADLPPGCVDGCGGMTLCLPEAVLLVLDTPGLRFLDLQDCPRLKCVDLGALAGEVHLTMSHCPSLMRVRLPPEGGAHVHVDAGAQPPRVLRLVGSIGRFDACWGRQGRFVRQARPQALLQGVHFGTAAPSLGPAGPVDPADFVALIGARPDDAATGVLRLGPALAGCRDLSLIEPDDTLLAVEWVGGALREFAVEGARGLMVARLSAPVEHLLLSGCPRLRAVTTEDAPAGEVALRACCTAPAAPRPRPGAPRVRPTLVVDVPCETLSLLDCGFENLRVFHPATMLLARCARLVRARVEYDSEVQCEGSLPWTLIDHVATWPGHIVVDEGLIARLRDGVLKQQPRAWPRLERLMRWPLGARARVAALQALCALLETPVPREALWQARCDLYRAQSGRDGAGDDHRWAWELPRDLVEDGYRCDFRLWAACLGGHLAGEEAHSMAEELVNRSPQVAQWLLPWLAGTGTPQGLDFLALVLLRVVHEDLVAEGVETAGPALLHALLHLFERRSRAAASAHPRLAHPALFDAARGYYSRRAEQADQLRWLAFEMQHDRPGTQARIALLLRAPQSPGRNPLTAARRAALTALMLTGQVSSPPTRSALPELAT